MPEPRLILITAFEPSGDALAAGLITELLAREPRLKISALGGPKMAAAGAELIEATTEHAVMLGGAASQAWAHHKRLKRLDRWLREHPIAALVPTDSPAANWSICKLVRKRRPRAKIVHLAAPQVWAWASWRISKLRRLTDHVLCLLPFEPEWLGKRGVSGTFVGHPLFERSAKPQALRGAVGEGLVLALLPGSRPGEIAKNWPVMVAAYGKLRKRHPELQGLVASVSGRATQQILSLTTPDGTGLDVYNGQADDVIASSDVVLAVSGTVTLQVASHKKPMVVLYTVSRLSWNLIGRWIVATRTFALPNLILEAMGQKRVVKELVPHFGAVGPVVAEVDLLLSDQAARDEQRAGLDQVCLPFSGHHFGPLAAGKLLEIMGKPAVS